MKKLLARIGASAVVLFIAEFASKFIEVFTSQQMAEIAIGQLANSNAAQTQFVMMNWFMSSGCPMIILYALVLVILYFIWKGQFKNV